MRYLQGNMMGQNCGTCEHWQQNMGIATVRECNCPIDVWLKANDGHGPQPSQTHREDGQTCKAWERRGWTDYLELWEAGKAGW